MHITVRPGSCTIACENHYPGYGAVATRRGKVVHVLGAPRISTPVVSRAPNPDAVIPDDASAESSAVVAALLGEPDARRWGAHLSGTFALAVHDPVARTCAVITDLGNAFHLFVHRDARTGIVRIARDIDALAHDAGVADSLDPVSLVEYLTQVSLTYPYTAYAHIAEVPFATCVTLAYGSGAVEERRSAYWEPRVDAEPDASPAELARALRDALCTAAEAIARGKRRVGIFLSGGTDSRAIAGILAAIGVRAHAMTIVDVPNVESRIAAAVAAANGHTHEVFLRDLEYYPRNTDATLRIDGPHTTIVKGMYVGFRDAIASRGCDAIVGGYMSDTLLKLHEANVVGQRLFGRHLGTLEVFDRTDERFLRGGAEYLRRFASLFPSDLLDAALMRRAALLETWRELRRDGSAWEWSFFWPCMRSQYNHNLTMNTMTYPSYEIFTDRGVIEVARRAPQAWKRNGRLFLHAVAPFLRTTAHVPLAATGLRIRTSPRVNEFLTAAKHLLPRRWAFPEDRARPMGNPIASNGSFPDVGALWRASAMLAAFRAEYRPDIEARCMRPQEFGPFDARRYAGIPASHATHIMYALLTYDRWQRYRVRRFAGAPRSAERAVTPV